LVGSYDIIAAVHSDLTGAWSVVASVQADLAGSYSVQGAAGTLDPAAVWGYVLSNGKTAEENLVEIHAMLTSGSTTASAVWAYVTRGLTETVDANIIEVRDQPLTGVGSEANPWGPA
jgi:hypothetical protein